MAAGEDVAAVDEAVPAHCLLFHYPINIRDHAQSFRFVRQTISVYPPRFDSENNHITSRD